MPNSRVLHSSLVKVLCGLVLLGQSACIRDRVKPYIVQERVNNKYRIRFLYRNSYASSVYVAGDFNNWTVPKTRDHTKDFTYEPVYRMKKRSEGNIWYADVLVDTGMIRYKYYVDYMRWELDQNNQNVMSGMDGKRYNFFIAK